MNSFLDIVGSTIIGGIILLIILNYNANLTEANISQTTSNIVQSNLNSIANELDFDFKKIGFGVSDSTKILTADTSRISFLSDIDNNGKIDTVTYYLSGLNELVSTPNPRDRFLYRVVNTQAPNSSSLGVIKFRLFYYDKNGNITGVGSSVKSFKVELYCESTFPIGENYYPLAYWNKTINPRNL